MNTHNIYILRTYGPSNKVLYKVGYASNMIKRLSQYKQSNPYIEVIATYYVAEGIEYERELHKRIPAVYGQEWYSEAQIKHIQEFITKGELPDPIHDESNILERISHNANFSFVTLCKLYISHRSSGIESDIVNFVHNEASELSFIKEIYDTYGASKIASLGYNKARMKSYVVNVYKTEIVNDLLTVLVPHARYTRKQIRQLLDVVYKKYGIQRIAKHSDLYEFFTYVHERKVDGIRYMVIMDK